jgi:hypothetical protein
VGDNGNRSRGEAEPRCAAALHYKLRSWPCQDVSHQNLVTSVDAVMETVSPDNEKSPQGRSILKSRSTRQAKASEGNDRNIFLCSGFNERNLRIWQKWDGKRKIWRGLSAVVFILMNNRVRTIKVLTNRDPNQSVRCTTGSQWEQ